MHPLLRYGSLLLLLCFNVQLSAQTSGNKPAFIAVYLKNGSVIHGYVLSENAQTMQVANRVKDTLIFAKADIDSLKPAIPPGLPGKHGFYNINEIGANISSETGLFMRFIAGYRFAYQWQAGIGIGLDAYKLRSAPLFADLRYDFSRNESTLFVYGSGGAAIPWITESQWPQYRGKADKTSSGFYGQAGVGYKFRWNKRNSVHISAGYSYSAMQLKYKLTFFTPERESTTDYEVYDYKFKRVNISIGFSL